MILTVNNSVGIAKKVSINYHSSSFVQILPTDLNQLDVLKTFIMVTPKIPKILKVFLLAKQVKMNFCVFGCHVSHVVRMS